MESTSPSSREVHARDFAFDSQSEKVSKPDEEIAQGHEPRSQPTIVAKRRVTYENLDSIETATASPARVERSSTDGLWDTPAASAKSTPAMVLMYREGPHIPEFCDSVVDRVSKRIKGRGHQRTTEPDRFENYLRGHVEARMADVYQSLSDKSAKQFQSLFWFGVFDRNWGSGYKTINYEDNLSACFQQARTLTRCADIASTRFCCIATDSPDLKKLFSIVRLFSTIAVQDPPFWFRALCAHLLLYIHHVEDGPHFVTLLRSSLLEARHDALGKLRLPSQRDQPAINWDVFTYTWSHVPLEFSAVKFNISLPYWHEPALEKIKFMSTSGPLDSYKITLLFSSDALLGQFKGALDETVASLQLAGSRLAPVPWDSSLGKYLVLFTIHRLMNQHLIEFLTSVHKLARERVIACRENAGRAGYLYIVVLEEDYATNALQHLRSARARLLSLDLDEAPENFQEEKTRTLQDIDFLETQLHETVTFLEKCRDQIKTFADLKQTQTTSIVTILAAIYVPFSFVCSYLGMNTTSIASGSIPTSTFWAAAIPLTIATILLPLGATIIRFTLNSHYSTRFFAASKLPQIVDLCMWALILSVVVVHIIHWRLATDGYFVSYFTPISPYEPVLVNMFLFVLEVLKAVEHTVQRNRRAWKWFLTFSAIALVAVLCAGLSVIDPTPATLVVPICFKIVCVAVRPVVFGDVDLREILGSRRVREEAKREGWREEREEREGEERILGGRGTGGGLGGMGGDVDGDVDKYGDGEEVLGEGKGAVEKGDGRRDER